MSLIPSSAAYPAPSFYLFDRARLRADVSDFQQAFSRLWPKVHLALSVKTNPSRFVLSELMEVVSHYEVVSWAEYQWVRYLGVPGSRIVVNGPVKGRDLIHQAFNERALVQLDGVEEWFWVREHVEKHPDRPRRLGFRLALDLPGELPSRFGFQSSDPILEQLCQEAKAMPLTRVESIHVHFCTRQRSAYDYAELARRAGDVALRVLEQPPDILNLGGGFLSPSQEEFTRQFPFAWTSFREYAEAITSVLQELFSGPKQPALMLEPGLAVEAGCMAFFTQVAALKNEGTRNWVQVCGSVYNIKTEKSQRNLPVRILRRTTGPATAVKDASVGGYTCMEDDVLHRGLTGELAVGDYLRFDQVGAYATVLKPPFIEPLPAVYHLDAEGGPGALAQPAQTWQNMFHATLESSDR
jgi:diaminopimelate decarboxylase